MVLGAKVIKLFLKIGGDIYPRHCMQRNFTLVISFNCQTRQEIVLISLPSIFRTMTKSSLLILMVDRQILLRFGNIKQLAQDNLSSKE